MQSVYSFTLSEMTDSPQREEAKKDCLVDFLIIAN